MSASAELPRYKCHKIVHALKITGVEHGPPTGMAIIGEGFLPIPVGEDWKSRFKPVGGDLGYYVSYDDGYKSWSPSKAFEEGYTRITQ